MDDKTRLKILEYWRNNNDKISKVPLKLKDIVDKKDAIALFKEIRTTGNIQADIFDHMGKIRRKIKEETEVESTKLHDRVIKWQIIVTIALVVATFFLVYATVHIGNKSNEIAEVQKNISKLQTEIITNQTKIAAEQTEILRISNQPYEAHIEIVPDYEDLTIPAWYMTDSKYWKLDAKYRWARITMRIYNFGKMDSQKMYCNPRTYGSEFYAYMKPDNFRIPAGSANKTTLHVFYEKCGNEALEFCDKPELVSTGFHNLTIDCRCDGCKTQRKFKTNITFCVFNENKTKECPV